MTKPILQLVMIGLLTNLHAAWAGPKAEVREPDYSKGEQAPGTDAEALDPRLQFALGPTGASAFVWGGYSGIDPSRSTRMLQIRSVATGSPADGVLQRCDVVLGVDGERFTTDARKALAAAITAAEEARNGGRLALTIWRPETEIVEAPLLLSGKALQKAQKEGQKNYQAVLKTPVSGDVITVTLTLPVKGTYSATTPWACDKTRVLIDDAARSIVAKGFYWTNVKNDSRPRMEIDTYLDALGMLATGEDRYRSVIRDYAQALARASEGLDIMQEKESVGTWNGAYRNLFLTEYYLATKDEKVLPGIATLATYFAKGQSGVGTWSHGMADVRRNGPYGPPGAYGAMNSCSLVSAIALVLTQKCGIRKKEIDEAVLRSLNFYRWYVDKGCIPYGDHDPAMHHDNNGRNAMAAVLFDLVGDARSAEFFTRMTLASYNQREVGHTGHYFSWQWGALGAARGGPEAAQSFIRNTQWYTELERRPNGEYLYQPQLHKGEIDRGKYSDWSTTGSRLLQHCLPRQQLYITGKGGSCVPPITGDSLQTTIAAAAFNPADLSVKDLLAALGNWSVVVREQAARELGEREDNVVEELLAMLESPDRYARYGACMGLAYAGRKSETAVNALQKKIQSDPDLNMRRFAVMALKLVFSKNGLAEAAKLSTPTLLKQAAIFEPEQDPMRKLHAEIASLMFYGGNVQPYKGYFPGGKGIEKVDRALLVPAMKSLLINPNGAARTLVSQLYPYLNEDDLKQLWGPIYQAVTTPAPSGVMFAEGVRSNGIQLMAARHVKEGLDFAPEYLLRSDYWGRGDRRDLAITALKTYGRGVSETFYPDIENHLADIRKNAERELKKGNANEAKKMQKELNSLQSDFELMKTAPIPDLISIQTYIDEFRKANSEVKQ